MQNAADIGAYMLDHMRDWPKLHPSIGDVRGRGLMIGIELVRDKVTKQRAGAERDRVVEACFERGLLVLGCGENTIRISPPLIITREQAKIAMDILKEAITAVEHGEEPKITTPSLELAPVTASGSAPTGA
jgi:4-aminobutyrate aminotransferase